MHAARKPKRKGKRNPVAKALRALDWLIQAPAEVGVRRLALALDLRPSNAHSLLSTLLEEGFVQRDTRTAHYSLGPELLRWAHLISARAPLREIAMTHMRTLVAECNETVFLGLYDASRREMRFAASVESDHPLRYAIELNRWIPMNTGASSLAILAWLDEKELDIVMERALGSKSLAADSGASRARLNSELQAIRRNGFAFSRAKRLAGAIGIGAPIFASGGNVIGDLVLTIPEQRFESRSTAKLARLVRKHAAAITAGIGGRTPDLPR